LKLDLKSTQNILINLESAKDRLKQTTEVLNKKGLPFERFSGIEHSQGIIGCGLSHYSILTNSQTPILVLEDDIEVTDSFNTVLNFPDEADAIYLGVSNHGYVRGVNVGRKGVVLASQYSEEYKRVYNMCSTHAILFISDEYRKKARDVVKYCLQKGIAFDLGLASIHKDFTILTPNSPSFYQTEQEEFTKFTLAV
jgi:hypothetical protein